jgi:hypothetical protein
MIGSVSGSRTVCNACRRASINAAAASTAFRTTAVKSHGSLWTRSIAESEAARIDEIVDQPREPAHLPVDDGAGALDRFAPVEKLAQHIQVRHRRSRTSGCTCGDSPRAWSILAHR